MHIEILILLFLCHFLADYTYLSTNWMLTAKKFGYPLFPIFVHASIHAILMGFIILIYLPLYETVIISLIQLSTHWLIDIGKGRLNKANPSIMDPTNKLHWCVFGMDQFFHTIVIIMMYWLIINVQ